MSKSKTKRLGRDQWVHRDAPDAVDTETWAYVPTGDPLLTRRARACAEYGHVLGPGYGGATAPYGGLVRHGALAEQLDKGSRANVVDAVARLRTVDVEDRAGIAIAGSYRVAAACLNRFGLGVGWSQGVQRAIATGTDPETAVRHRNVYEALNAAGEPVTGGDVKLWDQHTIVHGVNVVILAIRGGYTASEITADILADRATLAFAAALNQGVV